MSPTWILATISWRRPRPTLMRRINTRRQPLYAVSRARGMSTILLRPWLRSKAPRMRVERAETGPIKFKAGPFRRCERKSLKPTRHHCSPVAKLAGCEAGRSFASVRGRNESDNASNFGVGRFEDVVSFCSRATKRRSTLALGDTQSIEPERVHLTPTRTQTLSISPPSHVPIRCRTPGWGRSHRAPEFYARKVLFSMQPAIHTRTTVQALTRAPYSHAHTYHSHIHTLASTPTPNPPHRL